MMKMTIIRKSMWILPGIRVRPANDSAWITRLNEWSNRAQQCALVQLSDTVQFYPSQTYEPTKWVHRGLVGRPGSVCNLSVDELTRSLDNHVSCFCRCRCHLGPCRCLQASWRGQESLYSIGTCWRSHISLRILRIQTAQCWLCGL